MGTHQTFELNKTIVLIGMMGSGKSFIGQKLAKVLQSDFKDVDSEIEQAATMTITEIFKTHGEAFFRDGEKRVIQRLLDTPPHILATGGGAFCNAQTRQLIKKKACSIWLDVSLPELLHRVNKRPDSRPLLIQDKPETVLRTLMEKRKANYAQADIIISNDTRSHKKNIASIMTELQQCGIVTERSAI